MKFIKNKKWTEEDRKKYELYREIYSDIIACNLDFKDFLSNNPLDEEIKTYLMDILHGRFDQLEIATMEMVFDDIRKCRMKDFEDNGFTSIRVYGSNTNIEFPFPAFGCYDSFLSMIAIPMYNFKSDDNDHYSADIWKFNSHDAYYIDWNLGCQIIDFIVITPEHLKEWFSFFNEIFPDHRKWLEK